MKILKTIVLSSLVALSMGAFSSVAMAEASEGRVSYAPADAIDLMIGELKKAKLAAAEGKPSEEVYKLCKQAMDYGKDVNANDVVDRERSRANEHIKKARGMAKNNSMAGIEEHLDAAIKKLEEMKGLI
ncbi:hypothetical protein MCAMS1_02139 [biofilm metagenome]